MKVVIRQIIKKHTIIYRNQLLIPKELVSIIVGNILDGLGTVLLDKARNILISELTELFIAQNIQSIPYIKPVYARYIDAEEINNVPEFVKGIGFDFYEFSPIVEDYLFDKVSKLIKISKLQKMISNLTVKGRVNTNAIIKIIEKLIIGKELSELSDSIGTNFYNDVSRKVRYHLRTTDDIIQDKETSENLYKSDAALEMLVKFQNMEDWIADSNIIKKLMANDSSEEQFVVIEIISKQVQYLNMQLDQLATEINCLTDNLAVLLDKEYGYPLIEDKKNQAGKNIEFINNYIISKEFVTLNDLIDLMEVFRESKYSSGQRNSFKVKLRKWFEKINFRVGKNNTFYYPSNEVLNTLSSQSIRNQILEWISLDTHSDRFDDTTSQLNELSRLIPTNRINLTVKQIKMLRMAINNHLTSANINVFENPNQGSELIDRADKLRATLTEINKKRRIVLEDIEEDDALVQRQHFEKLIKLLKDKRYQEAERYLDFYY